MNFVASQFSETWLWTAMVLWGGSVLVAARQVAWRALRGEAVNAWCGACVLMLVSWLASAGLQPGIGYHLLGATILTLMAGPWLAWLGSSLVQLALAAGHTGEWLAAGLNQLVTVLPAIALTMAMLQFARRRFAANLFVYVFVNAFLAGAACMLLAALCGLGALALAGAYPLDHLLDNALPYYFLLSWSEAFTSGLVMAILIVYRPQWVATFDDARYLADGR